MGCITDSEKFTPVVAASTSSSNFAAESRDLALFENQVAAEEFQCCVCHKVPSPIDAMDHECCPVIFCSECYANLLHRNTTDCPFCRKPLADQVRQVENKNKKMFCMMARLKVFCDCRGEQQQQGCLWKGEWADLKTHLTASCQFVQVDCPLHCDAKIQRQFVSDHVHRCPMRLLVCHHCKEDVHAKDMEKHLNFECSKCPTTGIQCPVLGCTSKLPRCNLERHLQENLASHFIGPAVALKEEVTCLKTENMELRDSVASLQATVGRLLDQMNNFTQEISLLRSQLSTLSNDSTALQNRVQRAEGQISGMSNSMSTTCLQIGNYMIRNEVPDALVFRRCNETGDQRIALWANRYKDY